MIQIEVLLKLALIKTYQNRNNIFAKNDSYVVEFFAIGLLYGINTSSPAKKILPYS